MNKYKYALFTLKSVQLVIKIAVIILTSNI